LRYIGNETRLLSLMFALRVNSGTENKKTARRRPLWAWWRLPSGYMHAVPRWSDAPANLGAHFIYAALARSV